VAFIRAFGAYLPPHVVKNEEIGPQVGCDAAWIVNVSGIEERRFANGESVADLATRAAEDCLNRAGLKATDIGMILVSSGSAERQFPGPAAALASRLGLDTTPAVDLPIASAGSLFAMSMAASLSKSYGRILVVGAEKMSSVVMRPPMERGVAILFGDGAGACIIDPEKGVARIIDSVIQTDGTFREDLRLDFEKPLEMNGRSVILQASRKIPRAVEMLLRRNGKKPCDVDTYLMHQANQNLIARIAQALGVAEEKFFSNIRRYGNTSSASMLIAASEWFQSHEFRLGVPVCFASFGAGYNWGALLAEGVA
jgi:3-oxoacyl-[acyl-carrier-protein] synthase-3